MDQVSKIFTDSKIRFQKETFTPEKHMVFKISMEDLLSAALVMKNSSECAFDFLENILVFKRKKMMFMYYFFRSIDEGQLVLIKISVEHQGSEILKPPSLRNIWNAATAFEGVIEQQHPIEFQLQDLVPSHWKVLRTHQEAPLAN